ncbi:MAG: VOC family protein [Actinomycetota bacterium]|nr:VOC family protein [Actinomycetota bacterium]
MRLTHLALAVADRERSRTFYETHFGFAAGRAQECEDGVLIIRDAAGFDLALDPTGSPPEQPRLHFGFRCSDADEVRTLLQHVTDHGIAVIERVTEDALTSFKCLDPDGYCVEAYWDGAAPSVADL